MSEVWTKRGGKRIELFVPVKHNGIDITEIDISPVKWDHSVRWGAGEIPGALALLAELTGRTQSELRAIVYPDIERILAAFMSMLPVTIRESIERGTMPEPAAPPQAQARQQLEDDNDTGFDRRLTEG